MKQTIKTTINDEQFKEVADMVKEMPSEDLLIVKGFIAGVSAKTEFKPEKEETNTETNEKESA